VNPEAVTVSPFTRLAASVVVNWIGLAEVAAVTFPVGVLFAVLIPPTK
jgi:hypothetical protein